MVVSEDFMEKLFIETIKVFRKISRPVKYYIDLSQTATHDAIRIIESITLFNPKKFQRDDAQNLFQIST